jgi:hypothetical protein
MPIRGERGEAVGLNSGPAGSRSPCHKPVGGISVACPYAKHSTRTT